MAITATSQTLFDGERVVVMKFFTTMSATENESAVAKVTPSALYHRVLVALVMP
jgi:hypothetical protein